MRKSSSLIKEKQKRLNITYAELARRINIPVPTLLYGLITTVNPQKNNYKLF